MLSIFQIANNIQATKGHRSNNSCDTHMQKDTLPLSKDQSPPNINNTLVSRQETELPKIQYSREEVSHSLSNK